MKDKILEALKKGRDLILSKWGRLELRTKAGVIALAVLIGLMTTCSAKADLGPKPPVTFWYGAPAITLDGPALLLGIRHSWHPVDLVAEAVIQEKVSFTLLLARQVSDLRILGGVSLQSGAINPVVGVDYKRFTVRLSAYNTSKTVQCNSFPSTFSFEECSPDRTINKAHTTIMIGYVFPIGER